jgi:hypothetical protein
VDSTTALIAESATKTGLLFRQERDATAKFWESGMMTAGVVSGVAKEVVGVSASKVIEILNPTTPPLFLNATYQLTGWSVAGVVFFGLFPALIKGQIDKFDQLRKQTK